MITAFFFSVRQVHCLSNHIEILRGGVVIIHCTFWMQKLKATEEIWLAQVPLKLLMVLCLLLETWLPLHLGPHFGSENR